MFMFNWRLNNGVVIYMLVTRYILYNILIFNRIKYKWEKIKADEFTPKKKPIKNVIISTYERLLNSWNNKLVLYYFSNMLYSICNLYIKRGFWQCIIIHHFLTCFSDIETKNNDVIMRAIVALWFVVGEGIRLHQMHI